MNNETTDLTQITDIEFIGIYSAHVCQDATRCAICTEQTRRFYELTDEERHLEVEGYDYEY